jgi:hypothetical protein
MAMLFELSRDHIYNELCSPPLDPQKPQEEPYEGSVGMTPIIISGVGRKNGILVFDSPP